MYQLIESTGLFIQLPARGKEQLPQIAGITVTVTLTSMYMYIILVQLYVHTVYTLHTVCTHTLVISTLVTEVAQAIMTQSHVYSNCALHWVHGCV